MGALRTVARRLLLALGAAAALLAVGVCVGLVFSASARYVARAAIAEAGILARRRPIARVIADPATDAATRGKLELVLAARDFAASRLRLAAKRTYTTYTAVRRDTLVLVLSASRRDSLAPVTWNWPVVGRVPYKGFFDRDAALAEARGLEAQGLDTYLRVANAFSTLGWFEDPLLSTVVREDSVDLAATVIHEILHNTIWVPGATAFDESLAEFVGYRGAEAFFRARGDSVNAARAAARWRDEVVLSRFYDSLATSLERLYASGLARDSVAVRRAAIFAAARAELAGPLALELKTIDGRALARRPLNNAVVIAIRLYFTRLGAFDGLLAAHAGDLAATIADLRRRLARAGDPWKGLESGGG